MDSKEILAQKWDKTLANVLVKSGLGLTIGIGLSFILFRRQVWPVALSTGFGTGMAYQEALVAFDIRKQ
ncbi:hypothetical protein EDD86DRAFT_210690, partial [Gorgonomyces haynaldii]